MQTTAKKKPSNTLNKSKSTLLFLENLDRKRTKTDYSCKCIAVSQNSREEKNTKKNTLSKSESTVLFLKNLDRNFLRFF